MRAAVSLNQGMGTDHPLFFLHIPKTAGTTLVQVIERHFEEAEIARWLYPFRLVDEPADYFTRYGYYHGHVDYALMCELLPKKPVTMTMLRQPVERYLSHFGNHKRVKFEQIPDISREVYDAIQQTSLEDFIVNPPPVLEVLTRYFQNLQSKLLASELSRENLESRNAKIRTNEYVLPTPTFPKVRERLDELAFVGVTERFQESLFLMAYTFGWYPATQYQSFNTGMPRPEQKTLPAELLKELERLNSLDRPVYEHGCRLFNERYERMQRELLEHYGGRVHAHLKLPLNIETLVPLLDRHYQRCFKERNVKRRSIRLGFDRKMPGTNWYGVEWHPVHQAFRWSGPGRCAHLDFALKGKGPFWLRFELVHALTPETLENLVVSVNGVPQKVTLDTTEKHIKHYKAYVDQDVLARQPDCVRVSFEVEKPIRPMDVIKGNQDERHLGVAIRAVSWEPAPKQGGWYDEIKRLFRWRMKSQ